MPAAPSYEPLPAAPVAPPKKKSNTALIIVVALLLLLLCCCCAIILALSWVVPTMTQVYNPYLDLFGTPTPARIR